MDVWIPALFGLLGVIVGAVTAASATWVLERGTRRRRTRTAIRLVKFELLNARGSLRYARRTGRWWYGGPLATEWASHAEVLAAELQDPDWVLLERAYQWISSADKVRLVRAEDSMIGNDLEDWFLDESEAAVERAMARMAALLGDEPYPESVVAETLKGREGATENEG
jgi:hypothetical protein